LGKSREGTQGKGGLVTDHDHERIAGSKKMKSGRYRCLRVQWIDNRCWAD
jgi:hypothetical protein